ncbi:MAG: LamG domain-containing protein [Clostridia bacterium]|nr:LamG domain-containing protein [Clostridia bacterium]
MKKILSAVLACIMVIAILPSISFAGENSLCFTWAWDKNVMETDNSATVVSWSGGSNASYRSGFIVFDVPEDFVFDKLKTNVTADFTINSAHINNAGQEPTAAVVLVNGDKVKEAYNALDGTSLKALKNTGAFLGTYAIDSTPSDSPLENISLNDYFMKYPDAKSVGIYLTNLSSDGFECADGMASKMTSFDLDFNVTEDALSNFITIYDEEGNTLDTIYVRGENGKTYNVSDYVADTYFSNGVQYSFKVAESETFTVSANPSGVTVIYEKIKNGSLTYKATNSGYSGTASETGIMVATGGSSYASATRAPSVSGVSHNSGSATLGSARVGVMEFEIDSSIDPGSVSDVTLNFYVKKVHANLYSNWMRLGVYATDNPHIAEYSLGGMDYNLYPAINNDYSENAVYWSNEEISSSSKGWKTVDIRKIIVDVLDEAKEAGNTTGTIKIVLRLQVPTAGLYIASSDENNAPYLTITTSYTSLLAKYNFENLINGKAEDVTGNGYNALLLGDAKIENGELVLNGNGAAQIDSEDFRTHLDSYTIATYITLDGDAVSGTRLYDFGASSGNSGFLRVKDFGVGLKYNNGTTVIAGKNTGDITPFENDRKYHVAVTYDGAKKLTKVYVNGELVIETSDIKYGLDDFTDATPNNFIGRTNWYGTSVAKDNPDIKASYDDFSVYTTALDERVILSLYNPDFENDVKNAAIEIADDMSEYISSPVTEDLPFDTTFVTEKGDTFDVEWFTSDSSIVNSSGNVFRGTENLSCNVYAVVSWGEYHAVTRTMTVTVKALSNTEIEESLILRYTFEYDGNTLYNYDRANISENNVIKLPDDINVGVTDYTVAAWVRCDDLTRDGQRIYDFGMENGTVSGNYYAFTKINANGTLTVGINNGGSTQTITSVGSIYEGEWAHIAVAYSQASGETYIYINGELDSQSDTITYTMGGAAKNGKSTSNYIGRSQWYKTQSATNPDFVGKIDNFELYSSPLSASIIESLYTKEYDSPDVEIISAAYVDGMNKAVVNISSHGYEGEAKIVVANYAEYLDAVKTDNVELTDGLNSFAVEFEKTVTNPENVKCFVWQDTESIYPLAEGYTIGRKYEFNYDWQYPDAHLLNNEFSLKAYGEEEYLSLANSVSMASWADGDTNLLWKAPYVHGESAEGYYALQNVSGTYLALDTGSVKTNKINNWRFIQIDPELVDGKQNVYAIRQRSSEKYLARNGAKLIGTSDWESEDAWWELEIVNYDEISQMFTSPGFLSLSSNERARIYGVTSQAMWQSSNRRNKLGEYIDSKFFDRTKEDQAERLRQLFDYVPSQQINRGITTTSTGAHGTYDISEVQSNVSYKGMSGENLTGYKVIATYYTDTEKATVEQTVTIYGRSENTVKNLAKGFSYIPYQMRKYITNIRDYYSTSNQFNCGAKDMYVRTTWEQSAGSFATTAAHECGHSISGTWGWVCGTSRWKNAISADMNYVSGYGSNNSSEDFAEFTQFATSCAGDAELLRELKVMFPNRFRVLREIMREQNGGSCILDIVE